MENKIYEMYEVVQICADYVQSPETKEKAEAFENLKSSLIIKNYLPLKQKEIALKKILSDIQMDDEELYSFSTYKNICLLFDGLMAYVVNINYDIDGVLKDTEIYDLLMISGFVDFVLQYCYHDYMKLELDLQDILSMRGIYSLAKEFDRISPEAVDTLTQAFKRFALETDPQVLKMYADISAANDPLLNTIKKTVEQTAQSGSTLTENNK